jgi:hypothetical protein
MPCRLIRGWRYSSTHSLTSALDGGEWSASHLGRFTPRERAPSTHWIGGWVGPRNGLDTVSKIKIPSPCRELNPDHRSARSQSLCRLSYRCSSARVLPTINIWNWRCWISSYAFCGSSFGARITEHLCIPWHCVNMKKYVCVVQGKCPIIRVLWSEYIG